MGLFDSFVYTNIYGEKIEVQCKAFENLLSYFHVGDEVGPLGGRETYTIALPEYESMAFILVKDGIYIGLTDDVEEIVLPVFSKTGEPIE